MKNVFTKAWLEASLVRAIRTFAQTCVALIGTELVGVGQVNWLHLLSVSSVAAVLSILTSVAGLPEVTGTDNN